MRIPEEHENEEERFLNSDVGPFEILQARQLLESNIAAFAAKMATRADIDNLRRIIEQEQRAIAADDNSQDNNKMFHLVRRARRKIRCCWRRWRVSGITWTAVRCGSSLMATSPAARTA